MKSTSQSNANLVQARFLADLVLEQQDTAPIALTVGTVLGGIVRRGYIVIKDAPGAVIRKVDKLSDKYGLFYSLGPEGLLIDFSAAKEMTREEFFAVNEK